MGRGHGESRWARWGRSIRQWCPQSSTPPLPPIRTGTTFCLCTSASSGNKEHVVMGTWSKWSGSTTKPSRLSLKPLPFAVDKVNFMWECIWICFDFEFRLLGQSNTVKNRGPHIILETVSILKTIYNLSKLLSYSTVKVSWLHTALYWLNSVRYYMQYFTVTALLCKIFYGGSRLVTSI